MFLSVPVFSSSLLVPSLMVEPFGIELSCFRWTAMLLLPPSKPEALEKQVKGRQFEKSLHLSLWLPLAWRAHYHFSSQGVLSDYHSRSIICSSLPCSMSWDFNIHASNTQAALLFAFWLGLTNRRYWWENEGVGKGKDQDIYSSSYSTWDVALILAAFFYIRS